MDQQQSTRLSQLKVNALSLKSGDNDDINLNNPFAKKQRAEIESELIVEKENFIMEQSSELVFRESDYLVSTKIQEEPNFVISSVLENSSCTLNNYIVEKSLKTSVIFESDKSLTHWKKKMSDPHYIIESMKDPSNNNISFFYRYPDVSLPVNQRKNIHKALLNSSKKHVSNDENLIWYRLFSEKWRQALLSVFDTFKHGLVDYFYFVQENLTVLFERSLHDSSLKARMQLTTLALAEDLKNNGICMLKVFLLTFYLGIEYDFINKKTADKDTPSQSIEPVADEPYIEHDPEDVSEEDAKPLLHIKRPKKYFTKEDIVIEGCLNIAELVDFLINQKDRHSYAILPEIYSPGPFVYGTLRNNIISYSGPCKVGNGKEIFHLKANGIIFPRVISSLNREFESSGHKIFITVEREPNTDFLSAYNQEDRYK